MINLRLILLPICWAKGHREDTRGNYPEMRIMTCSRCLTSRTEKIIIIKDELSNFKLPKKETTDGRG